MLSADLFIIIYGVWLGIVNSRGDYWDFNFYTTLIIGTYRGTYLAYAMLFEPTSSDNDKKEGDNLSGNWLVNIQNLTTNIEKFLKSQRFEQENYT